MIKCYYGIWSILAPYLKWGKNTPEYCWKLRPALFRRSCYPWCWDSGSCLVVVLLLWLWNAIVTANSVAHPWAVIESTRLLFIASLNHCHLGSTSVTTYSYHHWMNLQKLTLFIGQILDNNSLIICGQIFYH